MAGTVESIGNDSPFVLPTLKDLEFDPDFQTIQALIDRIDSQEATITNLESKISALDATQEKERERIALDIAFDRQRIAKLEQKEPRKTELSRVDKIEKYLQARPDHKATFETLKGHLEINKNLLSQTIKILMDSSPGRYGITRTPGDKRKRTLVMLPRS